jgi:chromosome segregation ATPase
MNPDEQLKRISDKLQSLLKKYEALQSENERLMAELMPAKKREMALLEQIASLEQKVMVLKVSGGTMNDDDKKELDKKLHSYLKEIDRCIVMLSE